MTRTGSQWYTSPNGQLARGMHFGKFTVKFPDLTLAVVFSLPRYWLKDATMKWVHKRTAYDVLAVSPSSSTASITAKYKQLIVNVHPDRDPSKEALTEFKQICDAFEILSDPIQRKEYDQTLNANAASISFSVTIGKSGWRKTRAHINTADPKQREPMTANQFEMIRDIQRIEGFGTNGIRWDLVFEDCTNVAEVKGNASILLQYLFDVSALRRKSGNYWDQLSELGVTTLVEIRELNPILPEPPFNVQRSDRQRQPCKERPQQDVDSFMAAFERCQQVSIGKKINSLIEVLVNDMVPLFEFHFNRIRKVAFDFPTFTQIRPLLAVYKGNPKSFVGAAAFSDLLAQIVLTFDYDCFNDRKLEAAKDILSACIHRNSCRDKQKYKGCIRLVSGNQVLKLLSTWSKDDGLFGGDIKNGSIYLPLQHLVNVSTIVTQNQTIHDQYTQIMLMAIKLVLESHGITHSEEDYLLKKKKHYDEQREKLMQFLNASGYNPDDSIV